MSVLQNRKNDYDTSVCRKCSATNSPQKSKSPYDLNRTITEKKLHFADRKAYAQTFEILTIQAIKTNLSFPYA
jgi:hypothetical protein